jgi:hypothetical protein
MDTEDSLPCSQGPSTGPYPEPDQSNPYHPISKIHFNPFRLSRIKKNPQPGHQGILKHRTPIKQAVLLGKLVQQGHKVKNISDLHSVHPVVYYNK